MRFIIQILATTVLWLHPGILPSPGGPWALEPLRWVNFLDKGYLSFLAGLPVPAFYWLGMATHIMSHTLHPHAKGESIFCRSMPCLMTTVVGDSLGFAALTGSLLNSKIFDVLRCVC